MKKNTKKLCIVAVLTTLFVLISMNIAYSEIIYKTYNSSCENLSWRISKTFKINIQQLLREYSYVIQVRPEKEVDNIGICTNKSAKPQEPVKVTPVDTIKPSNPSNTDGNATDKSVNQPSSNNQGSNLDDDKSNEMEVVRLVNIEREKNGLKALELDTGLSKLARTKSKDMADNAYFSHSSPTYGSPFEMMKSFGTKYSYAGENIAKGFTTAEDVLKGWMNSEGHKANILSNNFTKIGVGYYKDSNETVYWTQMFIKP